MNAAKYIDLRRRVIMAGYAEEIKWAEGLKACPHSLVFRDEYCWVVLNSGMKEQIARQIWTKVRKALEGGGSAHDVFGHVQKATAIDKMWVSHASFFGQWSRKETIKDRMAFLRTLPFIGEITVFHFAKNLGMDVAKPDRHLVRISALTNETTQQMCERLSKATGHRVAVVDTVIWRAANLGLV